MTLPGTYYDESLPPYLWVGAATGATAGEPGRFTPTDAEQPANLADLADVTADPLTAWAPGEYVPLRDGTAAAWDGAAWIAVVPAGLAPVDVTERLAAAVGNGSGEQLDGEVEYPDDAVELEVAEAGEPGEAGQVESDPDSPVPGEVMTVERMLPVDATRTSPGGPAVVEQSAGTVEFELTVTAGRPGTYDPERTAATRPRNIGELRARARPADPAPWGPGEFVPVGRNGKRAHWSGEDWHSGEAP